MCDVAAHLWFLPFPFARLVPDRNGPDAVCAHDVDQPVSDFELASTRRVTDSLVPPHEPAFALERTVGHGEMESVREQRSIATESA
jgi:hypothetical protein